jgi:hypothetical protein
MRLATRLAARLTGLTTRLAAGLTTRTSATMAAGLAAGLSALGMGLIGLATAGLLFALVPGLFLIAHVLVASALLLGI